MTILDIGGGFNGTETQLELVSFGVWFCSLIRLNRTHVHFFTFLQHCLWQVNNAVMNMVDLYFPSSTGVSVIAEPGSFFVSSAFSFAVNIISKEVVARDGQDQAHGEFHLKKKKIIHLHLCNVGVTFNDRL